MSDPPGSRPSGVRAVANRIPFKLTIFFVAVSLCVEEFYPFSWFPMFTNLVKSTWYVYVTDGENHKLPIEAEFNLTGDRTDNIFKSRLSRVKKQDRRLSDTAALHQAGIDTLKLLQVGKQRAPPEGAPDRVLAIWRTDVRLVDGELRMTDSEIARLSHSEAVALSESAADATPDTPDGTDGSGGDDPAGDR